jgi:hypothetical protein
MAMDGNWLLQVYLGESLRLNKKAVLMMTYPSTEKMDGKRLHA